MRRPPAAEGHAGDRRRASAVDSPEPAVRPRGRGLPPNPHPSQLGPRGRTGNPPGIERSAGEPPAAAPARTRRSPPAASCPSQYPHRRGWHTDQSYRRPPPDISLFFAVRADGRVRRGPCRMARGKHCSPTAPPPTTRSRPRSKRQVDGLEGLHVRLNTGRSRDAVTGRRDRASAGAARTEPTAASRAHPPGDRSPRTLSVRGQPNGLVRRPARRHGAGTARQRRPAARRTDGSPHPLPNSFMRTNGTRR